MLTLSPISFTRNISFAGEPSEKKKKTEPEPKPVLDDDDN